MSEEASEIYVPDYCPSRSSWHNRSGLFGTHLKRQIQGVAMSTVSAYLWANS